MSASAHAFSAEALVRVAAPAGRVLGARQRGVCAFRGLPYAEPPVGALRWRPTRRAPAWSGERLALAPGPAPIQELPPRSSLLYRLSNDEAHALVMSEDCLTLNVWTPDPSTSARLPVFVWVHGGGNRTGHGAQDLFDGTRLAARGIVVVTLNMRLGALGFLALSELAAEDALGACGNYGLQDVVAALGWVQDNIAAFGGDPARVTLGGNSSGAAIVSHLMAAPAAHGLFRAAIGQSVSGVFRHEGKMPRLADAAQRGRAAVQGLGPSLEQLRDLPATTFLRTPIPGVIVDGRLLTEDSTDVFLQGRQAPVALLAGWNRDEGSLYATPAALEELRLESYGPHRESIERLYGQADDARRALVGDRRFIYPVWRWARTHVETIHAPTWLYEFEQQPPVPGTLPAPPDGGASYGAFHTAELPYTWDNLAARPWPWREADHALAARMADAWTRFVEQGDPNGCGLPTWRRLDPASPQPVLALGDYLRPKALPHRAAFDLFDAAYTGTKQTDRAPQGRQGKHEN